MTDSGLQRDAGTQREAHDIGLAEVQLADQRGNIVAHRFAAQRPVRVWRASMRLEMDGDHFPGLGQLGQVAAVTVWIDASLKENERLGRALHAVKEMLSIEVGEIPLRAGASF